MVRAITISKPHQLQRHPHNDSLPQHPHHRSSAGFASHLSGVISSAQGAITPIRLDGIFFETSGFNLTGVNSFTGDVFLAAGTLGINSNASLGIRQTSSPWRSTLSTRAASNFSTAASTWPIGGDHVRHSGDH